MLACEFRKVLIFQYLGKCVSQVHCTLVPELLHFYPETDGATLDELIERFGDRSEVSIWDIVQELIASGRAYVTVPLESMDRDEHVFAIKWKAGITTPAEIEAEFGPFHAQAFDGPLHIVTYDLYVENAPDPANYPPPPKTYDEREASNQDRSKDCRFPYTAIWPPKALQVEFIFDEAGKLARYAFKVGCRVT